MHRPFPRRNRFRAALAVGVGLIVLGTLYALQNLGVIHPVATVFVWPVILGLLALGSFLRRGPLAFFGHLLLLAAVALQLKGMGHMDLLARWWPLALVWLGLVKVLRAVFWQRLPFHFPRCQHSCER